VRALTPFKPLRVESGFVFIDDAISFLDTLQLVLSRYPMLISCFDHPAKLDPILENNARLLEKERETLHQIAIAQNPELDASAAVLALEYFASPWRKNIVGVLIADYDMPVETGDLFCERHSAPGLQRVLLTGKADEAQAIKAFNLGRIDHFLGKNEQEKELDAQGNPKVDGQGKPIYVPLLTIVRREMERHRELSSEKRGHPLLPVLDAAANEALQTRAVANALQDLLNEYRIREYMLLGLPLGILGLSTDRKVYWIQIETTKSKVSQLEQLEECDWSGDVVERVSRGETALNFSWMSQLGLETSEVPLRVLSPTPYFAVGVSELNELPPRLQPVFW
jgi:CheY-like chemotaxis protein